LLLLAICFVSIEAGIWDSVKDTIEKKLGNGLCNDWAANTVAIPVNVLPPCPVDANAAIATIASPCPVDSDTTGTVYCEDLDCNRETGGCERFHVGAQFCIRSSFTMPFNGYSVTNQCCYTPGGKLMLYPQDGNGAGSADLYHAMQSETQLMDYPESAGELTVQHFFSDVITFVDCCQMGNQCDTYFNNRPSRDSTVYS